MRVTTDLLLTLTTEPRLPHAAICRLGRSVETWAEESETSIDSLAHEIEIAPRHLRRAMALRHSAKERAAGCRERARRERLTLVTWCDPQYPTALRQLELPPPVLWLRGHVDALARLETTPAVSIVGSRRASPFGLEVAELFGRHLADAGVTVISGFAKGIDAAAHRGAIASARTAVGTTVGASVRSSAGPTIAVLGCGVQVDYPRGHRHLANQIADHGALISEFGVDRSPRAWCFPVRNRLIAALAGLTLIVEASERSGSLITARLALDLGREVWAVPGRIFDPHSLGANALLRDGAYPALSPSELVEALHLPPSLPLSSCPSGPAPEALDLPTGLSTEARSVLHELRSSDPRIADQIVRSTALPLEVVLNALLDLELAGIVRRQAGGGYCRRLATSDKGVLRCPPEATGNTAHRE